MKKVLLLLVATLLSFNSFSQTLTPEHFKQEVVETDITKDAMWNNLQKWVSSTFKSPQNVIEVDNKDGGLMTIRCVQVIGGISPSILDGAIELRAHISMTIEVKDNKYRYTIHNGSVEASAGYQSSRTLSDSSAKTLQRQIEDLEFIVEISTKEFNGSPDWAIDDKFYSVIKEYQDKLLQIPETNKKGKQTKEWIRCNSNLQLLKDAKNGYCVLIDLFINTLKFQMNANSDF